MVRRDGELEAAEVDCVDEVIPVAGSRGRHPGHGREVRSHRRHGQKESFRIQS